MHGTLPPRATRRLAVAAVLTLAPGLALAYFGYTAAGDRREALRVNYVATAALIRDRLVAEASARDSAVDSEAAPIPGLADGPSACQWLSTLANDRPWLADPFLVAGNGRVATTTYWSGWPVAQGTSPSPELSAALRSAEIAEFAAHDLDAALVRYRHAEGLARSPALRALVVSRIGRTLLKQHRPDESVRTYRTLVDLPASTVDAHGLPFAAVARMQIADALQEAGRLAEARDARVDLLRWALDHPWDVSNGYAYYLEGAGRDATGAPPDMTERAVRATNQLRAVATLHADLERALGGELARLEWRPETTRYAVLTGEHGSVGTIGLRRVASGAPGTPVIVGFTVRHEDVGRLLQAKVLTGIDLGPDVRAVLVGPSGRTPAPDTRAGAHLATADIGPMLPGWQVALVDARGRTLSEVSASERWTTGALIAGALVILLSGVIVTARAWMREAELAKLRTDFVSNVSHDLKTPLALIRMFGETLESGLVTDEARRQEFYGIIRRESERLTHLIDNVLDTAKIEAGTKSFAMAPVDLVAVVRDALDAYAPLLSRLGFTLHTSLPSSPAVIDADRDAVAQALVNLFQNAIKYSPDVKAVEVGVSRTGDEVRVSVCDRGTGIATAEIPRIFEKYYRVANPGLAGPAGSGLGLAIVQHVMAAHRGRVDVVSRPGTGSTFSLVFSTARAAGETPATACTPKIEGR